MALILLTVIHFWRNKNENQMAQLCQQLIAKALIGEMEITEHNFLGTRVSDDGTLKVSG